MRVCSEDPTKLSIEHVYIPITSDGGKEMLSYLAVVPSIRYWTVSKVSFTVTISASLIHVTFVGGDPEEEHFKVNTDADVSSRD